MFLLSPVIFPWDLAITLMIAGFVALIVLSFLARRRTRNRAKRFFLNLLLVLSALGLSVVIYGSFIEPQLITVTEETVAMPLTHKLKIAVISDFHVGPYKGKAYVERVVQRVNSLLPDIILLPGDFLLSEDGSQTDFADLSPLKGLQPAVGTFAILGNHDHGIHRHFFAPSKPSPDNADALEKYLTSLGIIVLRNGNVTVDTGTDKIAIAGIDDITAGYDNLDHALADIPPDTPTILLSHSPDVIIDTLSRKASLIVAGHTHGGQIRLPYFGAIAPLPTHLSKTFDQGIFHLNETSTLAITRGIGESGPRARLFAPPEILMLYAEPL